MKIIPVKFGWEILLLVYGIFFWMIYLNFSEPKAGSSILISLYFIFVTVCIFGIRYRIDDQTLKIRNGFFGTTKIDINKIERLEKTWNAISSPAPSVFGRVEIYFENNSIVISPKNFDEFKTELLKVNPNIVVKE